MTAAWNLDELLPHRPPMRLLDAVEAFDPEAKTLTATAGGTLKLAAPLLSGEITWGCYDADRIVHTPNPKNRYNPFVTYMNDLATIAADGTLTAKKAGEVMVVAMDKDLNKEIFPVQVVEG